jgi:hypothetical protein
VRKATATVAHVPDGASFTGLFVTRATGLTVPSSYNGELLRGLIAATDQPFFCPLVKGSLPITPQHSITSVVAREAICQERLSGYEVSC